MSRYFFHLRDGVDYLLDPEGVELAALGAAKAYATRSAYSIMAAELGHGKLDLSVHIEIVNAEGAVLATVYFRDLVTVTGLAN